MKGRSPDETAAAGRVTSVHQQERGSADQPDQPSNPAQPSEDTEDSSDGTSFVAQESPPARPSGSSSGDDTPCVAVEGGFTPTASEGREKDPRDDDTGKSTTSSTSVGLTPYGSK
ncbi:hypothetical protein THAOC_37672 [Thalassiosira oceanica]|uniref:Uncharacterized protein n=1 Tax=Thalassiosira oceanica TaxID=159749 RepID=K0QY82_THAOC|nr:hypothetical protein THAOC_37672 [Thalassiosira oceanica]|eukprot:EJK43843.1 hypothetical protein THAOC_37672 [Thalassiosira oceanica]